MTIRQLIFLAAALFLLGLVISGCNDTTQPDSPAVIAAKVNQAARARHSLWEELQKDKAIFSEEEWAQAIDIHAQTVDLSARITVSLSAGTMPPVDDVAEWVLVGEVLYQNATFLMTDKHPDLSFGTQSAWAMEKARLSALLKSADKYMANPNAVTYETMAYIGLALIDAIL